MSILKIMIIKAKSCRKKEPKTLNALPLKLYRNLGKIIKHSKKKRKKNNWEIKIKDY